jgi:hypothetical protein
VPKTVVSIGDAAFASCSSLVEIDVDPANPAYSSLGGVLYNTSHDTLIQYPAGKSGEPVIPNSVTTVGAKAFALCSGLTNITLPNTVTSIGDNAFANCSGLASFVIPAGVRTIGFATFSSCSRMGNVTIPNTVTNIADYAFTFCGLTNLHIPVGVVSIGNVAFGNCTKLVRATISKTVQSIGIFAFSSCTALQELYFEGNCPNFGTDAFSNAGQARVFYSPGTTGWGSFSDLPAQPWDAKIVSNDSTFGVDNGQFSFNISGSSGVGFVVEATPSLANPVWTPLLTNVLSGGLLFKDNQPLHASGFYRLRSP